MKLKKIFLLGITVVFLLNGCFSDYSPGGDLGSITINPGSVIARSDGSSLPAGLIYSIELVNGPGSDIKPGMVTANDPPQTFTVAPGNWTVVIRVYEADGVTLYAEGSQTINIRPGDNGFKQITINAVDQTVSISFSYSQESFIFTPLEGEKTGTVNVTIGGLIDSDLVSVNLSSPITGVSLSGNTGLGNTTDTPHTITINYNGAETTLDNTVTLTVSGYDNTKYTSVTGSQPNIGITVYDGVVAGRAIPVRQANIVAFNTYANTSAGLSKHYKLEGNIDLIGIDWNPIGTSSITSTTPGASFSGTFDGNNKEITNLTISKNNTNFHGLFGYVTGTIENLTLTEVNIEITTNDYRYGRKVGAIAGQNDGMIRNCFVASGTVKGGATVGGIAGHNGSNPPSGIGVGTITNSGNTGCNVISTNINSTTNNYTDAGGVAGYNNGTISNSFNYATIDSTGTSITDSSNTGGVVGYNEEGRIFNCYNVGEVKGKERVGGILGYNQNTAATVYNNVSLGILVKGTLNVNRVIGSGTGSSNFARSEVVVERTGVGTNDGTVTTSWNTLGWWKDTAGFDVDSDWWTGKLPPPNVP